MNDKPEPYSIRKLIPVPDWNRHHPWPSPAALRNLIFLEQTNGFARCVRRCGRRVLIDQEQFFQWVDERSGKEKNKQQ